MLKIFSGKRRRKTQQIRDARNIYQKAMQCARQPGFFAKGMAEDSMTGRMEVLCLHLGVLHMVLRKHGENGALLSQALYDVMVDDFDIALREEGLSDTAVKRRIKPMVKMFFDRARQVRDAFQSEDRRGKLAELVMKSIVPEAENKRRIARYFESFHNELDTKTLGQLALGQFEIPPI